jgi:hypothetical protein
VYINKMRLEVLVTPVAESHLLSCSGLVAFVCLLQGHHRFSAAAAKLDK